MKKDRKTIASQVSEALQFIRAKIKARPKIAIVLGSGLGDVADTLSEPDPIDTSAIPSFPRSTVESHHGRLVFGRLGNVSICALQGRVHYYETGELEPVLYPVRILHALGIKTLIITNAAGGINRFFKPADLMLITDQINLTFENPLRAIQVSIQHQQLYDPNLQEIIDQVGKEKDIPLHRGIYCGLQGPSYETAAEIEMIRRLGGDAVGMSTVNEVSLASSLGMRVAGISCITNLSTGISDQKLSHGEVTEVARAAKQSFGELLRGIIQNIG
ncbi:MAG: purine-nucleoside phosphorylase [Ignavibacteria bacterium]|nr:purine-nucleoside phosphorylase [Ignavibacteria bacterium]